MPAWSDFGGAWQSEGFGAVVFRLFSFFFSLIEGSAPRSWLIIHGSWLDAVFFFSLIEGLCAQALNFSLSTFHFNRFRLVKSGVGRESPLAGIKERFCVQPFAGLVVLISKQQQ